MARLWVMNEFLFFLPVRFFRGVAFRGGLLWRMGRFRFLGRLFFGLRGRGPLWPGGFLKRGKFGSGNWTSLFLRLFRFLFFFDLLRRFFDARQLSQNLDV